MKTAFICYYCNSKSGKMDRKINIYKLYYCNSCQFLFTSIDENRKFINKRVYDSSYLNRYEEREERLTKRFFQRVNEIERYIQGGTVLDYGCSTGLFLKSISKQVVHMWKLYGIDINKESIARAKRQIPNAIYKEGKLTKNTYKEDFFDCITCFDVLEHDENLHETLSIFRKILKPGGLLVVQSPNYMSIMATLCGENWDWWSVPDHLFHFNPHSLRKIIAEAGFEVKKLSTWDSPQDFVLNVRGSMKRYLPRTLSINKIVAKVSPIALYCFWAAITIHKRIFNSGGLLLLYAQKR